MIAEIKANVRITGLKNIYFIDDNLTGHRDYAKELFQALLPLKLRWSCLWTINTSRDEELLDLAKRSGCSHVNIGIENVCPESISSIEKVQNPVAGVRMAPGPPAAKGHLLFPELYVRAGRGPQGTL